MNIIMMITKFNKNTMAALAGAVERDAPELLKRIIYFTGNPADLNDIRDEMNIFVYSFTTPQSQAVFKEFTCIKNRFPGAVIFAGGPHACGDPESVINAGADYVITGEGEAALTSLLKSADSLPGRGIIHGTTVDFSDYPCFPFSDPNRALYIELTRGCPYNCSFCRTSSIFGIAPRHRSPESVLKNAEAMLKHKLTDLRFVTPNALSYGSKDGLAAVPEAIESLLKHLHGLCARYNGRIFLGSFPSEIRPEFASKELMLLLKKYVSNDNVIIGAQSGSEAVLKSARRHHSSETVLNAVNYSLSAGFKVNVDFLFGFPEESDEKEALKSISLMDKLLKSGARIHAHKLIPVSGTIYYQNKMTPKIHPKIMQFLHNHHGKGLIYGKF